MPEPLTFVRSQSASVKPHSRDTASVCTANASLISMRSMSARVSLARSRAFAVAGTGPMPIRDGSTPARAHDTTRTMGTSPNCAARSGVVTMQAAAASFWPLAFPAVTVALASASSMMGRRFARASSVVSARGVSSTETTVSPQRLGMVTGTISSSKIPADAAATARSCDRSA